MIHFVIQCQFSCGKVHTSSYIRSHNSVRNSSWFTAAFHIALSKFWYFCEWSLSLRILTCFCICSGQYWKPQQTKGKVLCSLLSKFMMRYLHFTTWKLIQYYERYYFLYQCCLNSCMKISCEPYHFDHIIVHLVHCGYSLEWKSNKCLHGVKGKIYPCFVWKKHCT